jgi:hypothetical protein
MNTLYNAILLALLSIPSLAACLAGLSGLFPLRVEKARAVLERSPGRSLLIGAVNWFFFLALALVLAQSGDLGRVLALLTALVPIAGAGLGLAALCGLAGGRLFPAASPFYRVALGTLVLGLGVCFPLLGWFLLLPGCLLAGLGALVISLFRREA